MLIDEPSSLRAFEPSRLRAFETSSLRDFMLEKRWYSLRRLILSVLVLAGATSACEGINGVGEDVGRDAVISTVGSELVQTATSSGVERHCFVGDPGSGAVTSPTFDVTRLPNATALAAIPAHLRVVGLSASAATQTTLPEAPTLEEQLQGYAPDEQITVIIDLTDPAFDFTGLAAGRSPGFAARAAKIQARKASLQPLQQPVLARLRAIGVTDMTQLWVANRIIAKVPAGLVLDVLARPTVEEVFLDAVLRVGTNYTMYHGRENSPYPDNPNMRTHHLFEAGITGAAGNGVDPSTPVRYAILEVPVYDKNNMVTRDHVNWMDNNMGVCREWCTDANGFMCVSGVCSGPSRLWNARECDEHICNTSLQTGDNDYPTHGGMVTSLLMGSIDEGQHPDYAMSAASYGGGQAIDAGVSISSQKTQPPFRLQSSI